MYFHIKIKYNTLNAENKKKSVREEFIVDNVTYGGAEADMYKVLEGRVKSFTYDVQKIRFNAVYDPFVFGDFFKVVVELTSLSEKGEERKTKYTQLVAAQSEHDAGDRARKYFKSWTDPSEVIKVEKTAIVGVWGYNDQWREDFKERMHNLFDDGQHSPDANQLSMFNFDGSSKTSDGVVGEPDEEDEDDNSGLTDAILGGPRSNLSDKPKTPEELEQDATDLLDAIKNPVKEKLTQEQIKANRQANAAQQKRGGNGQFGSKVTGKLTLQSVDGTPEKDERGESQSFPVIE